MHALKFGAQQNIETLIEKPRGFFPWPSGSAHQGPAAAGRRIL